MRKMLSLGAIAMLAALLVVQGSIAAPDPDVDGDGVSDLVDNCLDGAAMGGFNPSQTDTDGDGFGNWCDADYNNSGDVNITDFNMFRICFYQVNGNGDPTGLFVAGVECTNMDHNDSGTVNTTDSQWFAFANGSNSLGPSGLPCASRDATSPSMTGAVPCVVDPNGSLASVSRGP